MKKVLKVLGLIIGVLVLAMVILNVVPKTLSVERSIVVNADPALVREQVVKFENFKVWSPWSGLDPSQKTEITGVDGTPGAKFSWASESEEVGTGFQTIKNVSEERIDMELEFTAPWESKANTYFIFNEVEDGLKVTWGFKQEANLMMGFFGIEEMLAETYDEGLTELKKLCESK
jgi:hypothetical protein